MIYLIRNIPDIPDITTISYIPDIPDVTVISEIPDIPGFLDQSTD